MRRFLGTRPALYRLEGNFYAELYDTLFALEYPDGPPPALTGPDGHMALRPNNSWSWEPYEPEYGKYGGPRRGRWPSGTSSGPARWSWTRSPPATCTCARWCSGWRRS